MLLAIQGRHESQSVLAVFSRHCEVISSKCCVCDGVTHREQQWADVERDCDGASSSSGCFQNKTHTN